MSFLFAKNLSGDLSASARLQLCGEVLVNLSGCTAGLMVVVEASGAMSECVMVGPPGPGQVSVGTEEIELLVRQSPRSDGQFIALAPCHCLVGRILGDPPPGMGHSVIGRMSYRADADIVIVAAWRPTCLEPLEAALLSRASAACRNALTAAMSSGAAGVGLPGESFGAGFDLINSVVSPVIRVDERLTIVSMNEPARRELACRRVLHEHNGRLASNACDAMEELRTAVRRSVRDTPPDGRRSSIIPLASDAGLPRFAIVAPSPLHGADPTAVVVLPEVDGHEGARRLASLYSLTRAEEGVVRLVLTGAAPVEISGELGLTEATVRTYLKRIMLKLGINRRSEFFLLYILTMSPFRLPADHYQRKSA